MFIFCYVGKAYCFWQTTEQQEIDLIIEKNG